MEHRDKFLEASGVVEPWLIPGELVLAEELGDSLAVYGASPLDVMAVQRGWVGFAGTGLFAAGHVAHDDAAGQRSVDLGHGLTLRLPALAGSSDRSARDEHTDQHGRRERPGRGLLGVTKGAGG